MPTILKQGDRSAWEAFRRDNPDEQVSYDPFQKILHTVRARAIADANFCRVLFMDDFANGQVSSTDFLDGFAYNVMEFLKASSLRLSTPLRDFFYTSYRQMFTVACVPVTINEQIGRLYSINGVSDEEYKQITAQAGAGVVVDIQEE